MQTLTYVYGDSTAVLGPLATRAEPHCYDLCSQHAGGLSVPRGWEVIRLGAESDPEPSSDDLLALADAVREAGFSYEPAEQPPLFEESNVVELRRRGHLRMVADSDVHGLR